MKAPRIVKEDTVVAYDKEGHGVPAEDLQRWAYNQLANAKIMYDVLKQAQEEKGDWRGMIDLVLSEAEGK